MIQKRKAEYLLKKSYDKSRTLESFCKYQENRFNQGSFNSTYVEKNRVLPEHVLNDTQTDQKVQQIKAKYGLCPKKVYRHERSMTCYHQNQQTRTLSRQPLAEHAQKNNFYKNKAGTQQKPQRRSFGVKGNTTSQKGKQNLFGKNIEYSNFKILNQPQKQQDYNVTFNQSVFKNIDINLTSHIPANTSKYATQIKRTQQFFNKQMRENKELWPSNLNPRIENINKINNKIKEAISNITNMPFSINQSYKQQMSENDNIQKISNNDMIQTRIVGKKFKNQQKNYNVLKRSYITGDIGQKMVDNRIRPLSATKNNCYLTKKNLENNNGNSYKKQKQFQSQKYPFQKQFQKTNKDQKLAITDEFSFQTEHQQKQQTVRKNNQPNSQNKFNMIKIKQEKSQYFEQIKQIPTQQMKKTTLQSQKLSFMTKLAVSSISAKKEVKQVGRDGQKGDNKIHFNQFQVIENVIKRQIELDQTLRKGKYWLKYHNDDQKWANIKKLLFQRLSSRNKLFNCNQIQFFNSNKGKHILNSLLIQDSQIDPFYSVRLHETSYNQIVNRYFNAYDHWNSAIQDKKVINEMIQTKWIGHIDIEKKGFATVTDLTRFVNFVSQGFYKNRDLVLLFSRLCLGQQSLQNERQFNSNNSSISAKQSLSWFKQSNSIKLTQQNLKKLLSKQKN